MLLLLLFIIGCFLGSFIGVCADRLSHGEQVLYGRSHCEYCHHVLALLDLIPLISFVRAHGRCRYCKKKLSLWYPFVEVISGMILVLTWIWVIQQNLVTFSTIPLFILYSMLFLTLWALFIADVRYGMLPDVLVAVCVVIAVFLKITPFVMGQSLLSVRDEIIRGIATGSIASTLFIGIDIVTQKFLHKHGMGMGDVKLVFFIGLLLGFPQGLLGIYLAFLTGGIVAAILIIVGAKKFGQQLVFGPFLIVGTVIMVVWGNYIIESLQRFIPL